MSPVVPEPIHQACMQRVRGVLLDSRRERVLTVELLAIGDTGLRVQPHMPHGDTAPPDGALVRLRVKLGNAVWVLATHVCGQAPLTLRLPGVLTRENSRAAERVVPEGVRALWIDDGHGPVAARLKDLSLGGIGCVLPGGTAVVLGGLVSVRLECAAGELRCLARVRHSMVSNGEVRVGVEFGELTTDAGRLLGRLVAVRATASGSPGAQSTPSVWTPPAGRAVVGSSSAR